MGQEGRGPSWGSLLSFAFCGGVSDSLPGAYEGEGFPWVSKRGLVYARRNPSTGILTLSRDGRLMGVKEEKEGGGIDAKSLRPIIQLWESLGQAGAEPRSKDWWRSPCSAETTDLRTPTLPGRWLGVWSWRWRWQSASSCSGGLLREGLNLPSHGCHSLLFCSFAYLSDIYRTPIMARHWVGR